MRLIDADKLLPDAQLSVSLQLRDAGLVKDRRRRRMSGKEQE